MNPNLLDEIIQFVSKIGKIPKEELHTGSEIFNSNILTSLGLLELISCIEKQYNLVILPEELIHENFGTIGLIVDFVSKKCEK
jgi:acyl carrier protein